MCLLGRIRSRKTQVLAAIGTTVQSLTGIMKFDRVMAKVYQIAQPMSIAHRLKAPIRPQETPADSVGQSVVISGMSTKVLSSLAEAPYEKYSLPKMTAQIIEGEINPEPKEEGERPNYRDVQFYEVIMEALLDAGVNPGSLEGTDTGIFIGHSLLTEVGHDAPDHLALESLRLSYIAKRIGMVLKTRGQEQFFQLDKGTGFLLPLNKAVSAVSAGHCEAAVVACAVRDVSAVFIQRPSSALRPYASIEFINQSTTKNTAQQLDLTGLVKSVRRGADLPGSQDPLEISTGPNSYLRVKLQPAPAVSPTETKKKLSALPVILPYSNPQEGKVEDFLRRSAQNGNRDRASLLLHNIYGSASSLPGHKFRGYAIINKGEGAESDSTVVTTGYVSEEQQPREVWFIFPGLGSQFSGMGSHLMEIPPFRESIIEAASILETEGIDLFHILDPLNNEVHTSIRSAMVAITSVQIGLVNLMTALGIKPEGYIGYSCGEIMCAYCDGAFDAREALLVSKIYGECIQSVNIARGTMCAIGLSWNEVKAILPPDLYIACNNSPNNVTIGGPTEAVEQFVTQLREKGIKTWPVNSCGFAPHSHSFSRSKGLLLSCLERVITAPITRSPKWISTSLHDEDTSEFSFYGQNTPLYYFNNLQSPVLFHEAVAKIPNNSVVIEIGLTGMLQTVLRDSLASDCQCLSLGKCKKDKQSETAGENEVVRLMANIGDIFNAGVPVDFSRLYLPDKFPASSDSSASPSLAKEFQWESENAWKEFGSKKPKEPVEEKKGLKLEELM